VSEQTTTQEERVLAALAHGGVLLGFFTGGIGGMIAALVIWLVERGKSAYAAAQALQALVYQVIAFVVVGVAWCCWGMAWLALILVPLWSNPQGFEGSAPPAEIWIGMALMAVPLGVWALTILYGLIGAVRCLQGRGFRYALIGRWLNSR
jgi:uncharacterized Tic20 family protein